MHDIPSLSASIEGPIYLSINIQSLMSKHENLVQFINDLNAAKISVDVIALQEIWDVRYHELVNIPGYKPLIYKKRRNMRRRSGIFYKKQS